MLQQGHCMLQLVSMLDDQFFDAFFPRLPIQVEHSSEDLLCF